MNERDASALAAGIATSRDEMEREAIIAGLLVGFDRSRRPASAVGEGAGTEEGNLTMGYMRHHSIVVTYYDEQRIAPMHAKAVEIFGKDRVTEILPAATNGYVSFFIGTDGSKEGWDESKEGDA